jgi:hypothetical protein
MVTKKITKMILKYVVFFPFKCLNLNTCYIWILWLKFWKNNWRVCKIPSIVHDVHKYYMMCTSTNKKCGAKGEENLTHTSRHSQVHVCPLPSWVIIIFFSSHCTNGGIDIWVHCLLWTTFIAPCTTFLLSFFVAHYI